MVTTINGAHHLQKLDLVDCLLHSLKVNFALLEESDPFSMLHIAPKIHL